MVDTNPAITEPAPRATKNAGNAQHNKVLKDENNVSVVKILFFKSCKVMDCFFQFSPDLIHYHVSLFEYPYREAVFRA